MEVKKMISKEQAFANIKKSCEEQLHKIYCAGVPDFALERFNKEIEMLKSSETILQFEAYRIISKVAREHSIPMITGNGTFIAYLIGYMGLNPLPSHYYCPCCGKSECHNNYNQFGIDLPPKNCSCGNQMISMGIDIPFDCVWGSKKQKENQSLSIRTVWKLIPLAAKAVSNHFGYDYIRQNLDIQRNIISTKTMEFLYECQNRTGLIVSDIPISELSALDYKSLQKIEKICGEYPWIKAIQPSTKREISRIFSAVHSMIKNISTDVLNIKKMFESELFQKYPFIEREDIYIYLIEKGVSSEDSIKAYEKYSKINYFSKALESYNFESEFYEVIEQYNYLFSRSFNAAMIYHYLLLAKYAEIDYNMFTDVIQMYISVDIYSRDFIENYILPKDFFKNTAVISFYDPDRYSNDKDCYSLVDYNGKSDNVLYIPLDDFQTELPEADKIAEFVYSAKSKELRIICQCESGQNRSAGCAAAILEHFSKSGSSIFNDDRYHPDEMVYYAVLDALTSYKENK